MTHNKKKWRNLKVNEERAEMKQKWNNLGKLAHSRIPGLVINGAGCTMD